MKIAHKDTPELNPCCYRFAEEYEIKHKLSEKEYFISSEECPECGHYIGFYINSSK